MSDKTITIQTSSAEETQALGERIGRALEPGVVIALTGGLGAGKTTLTKGIARGLEVADIIHSPTFTLIHEHEGRLPVYHFDLYRLDTPEQLDDLGHEDYFYGGGVAVIEWAERAGDLLPPDRVDIHITGEDDLRTLEISSTGPVSARIVERLAR